MDAADAERAAGRIARSQSSSRDAAASSKDLGELADAVEALASSVRKLEAIAPRRNVQADLGRHTE